ncbi:hypothetical protein [Micromonospora sp. NPDC050695]|uniref:hypothetical protein n=1 Tax=Micromonospora sp. NPDC050695 TaxID=3154938 RepID=UPI0033DE1C06
MDVLLLELAKALIWALGGFAGGVAVVLWRQDRAEAARDDARANEQLDELRARLSAPPMVELPTVPVLDPKRTVNDIFDRVARGAAPVNRPFDEQIRDRNDVLHWLAQPVPPSDEPTTLLSRPVESGAHRA